MTNDDEAREARSVACADAPGRFQLPCFKCRAIAPEEVCDDRIFETSSLATCPARRVTLGVLLCSDQFNRYDPLVNKVADAIQSADGDEVAMAQAAIRVIAHHVERAYAARSESEDTQAKPDWNPNEGVICDGSTNHIEFQPTPTQADVDALVKAAGFAANRLAVICESAKHDMTTKEKSALSALNAALTPFQKG